MRRFAVLALWLATLVVAAEPVSEPVLFGRIYRRFLADLDRVERMTCLETLRRTALVPGRLPESDQIQLEVGAVNGVEMFGRPGGDLTTTTPSQVVAYGASTSGELFLHTKAVIRPGIKRTFRGEEQRGGETLLRFDYEVPQFQSTYFIGSRANEEPVEYSGSYFVHPTTYALREFLIYADRVPPFLRIQRVRLRYEYVDLPGRPLLLPRATTLVSRYFNGSQFILSGAWTHCRSYGAESRILDEDDSGTTLADAKKPERQVGLRGELTTSLSAPLDIERLAFGDPVEFALPRAAALADGTPIPRGTRVIAVVSRLERSSESGTLLLGLAIDSVVLAGRERRFLGYATDANGDARVRLDIAGRALPRKPKGSDPDDLLDLGQSYGADIPGQALLVLPAGVRTLKSLTFTWSPRPRY